MYDIALDQQIQNPETYIIRVTKTDFCIQYTLDFSY